MRIDQDLCRRDLKYPAPPADLSGPDLQKWYRVVDMELDVEINGSRVHLSGEKLKKWKYERYMRDYLACVESIDTNVGRLLDYLEKNGLAENTLLIYTSDQGFFLGDHNWYDKRFMYEESLRMPLLMRWPATINPGRSVSSMVLNVDFAPTLLEAAGIEKPRDLQGQSFLAALRGDELLDWRTSMYYRYYHYPQDHQVQPHYGVRTERFKLIYFPRMDSWELYDLLADPHELNNLADQAEHQPVLGELKQELDRLRSQLGDKDQFADDLPPYGV